MEIPADWLTLRSKPRHTAFGLSPTLVTGASLQTLSLVKLRHSQSSRMAGCWKGFRAQTPWLLQAADWVMAADWKSPCRAEVQSSTAYFVALSPRLLLRMIHAKYCLSLPRSLGERASTISFLFIILLIYF